MSAIKKWLIEPLGTVYVSVREQITAVREYFRLESAGAVPGRVELGEIGAMEAAALSSQGSTYAPYG